MRTLTLIALVTIALGAFGTLLWWGWRSASAYDERLADFDDECWEAGLNKLRR